MSTVTLDVFPNPYSGRGSVDIRWRSVQVPAAGTEWFFCYDTPVVGSPRPTPIGNKGLVTQQWGFITFTSTQYLNYFSLGARYICIGKDTVQAFVRVSMETPTMPPPLDWKPPANYINTTLTVQQRPEDALNALTVTGINSPRITITREDPIFGNFVVRGAYRLLLRESQKPMMKFIDGELPLDTPVKYCMTQHFDEDPYKRPVVQRNLLPNPSFERGTSNTDVSSFGKWWDFDGRTAERKTFPPPNNIVASWAGASLTDATMTSDAALGTITVMSTDDGPAEITTAPISVGEGERYQIALPVRAGASTRILDMRVTFDPGGSSLVSDPVVLQDQLSQRFVRLSFFVPRGATSLTVTLSARDEGQGESSPGEMFVVDDQFVLDDEHGQEVIRGDYAVTLGPAAEAALPLPTSVPALPDSSVYGLLRFTNVDPAHVEPGIEHAVSGSVIIDDIPGASIPLSWALTRRVYGAWNDPRLRNQSWASLRDVMYDVNEISRVYLVGYDAAGTIVQAVELGTADNRTWLTFSRVRITPQAGVVQLGLAHSQYSPVGVQRADADTQPLKWRVDGFMLEKAPLLGSIALPYLDGDQDVYATDQPAPLDGDVFGQPGWVVLWEGGPHDSVSSLLPPQNLKVCDGMYTLPSTATPMNCVSVHLADALLPEMSTWATYVGLDSWEHPARVERHAVINRYTPIPVNDIRLSALNTLTVITTTFDQRVRMRRMLQSGRVLILKFPRTRNWGEIVLYISVGDVSEQYIFPDFARPERRWELPFQVVTRPLGHISIYAYNTWRDVRDAKALWRTWRELMENRRSWADVLTEDLLDSATETGLPQDGGYFAGSEDVQGVVVPNLSITSGLGRP